MERLRISEKEQKIDSILLMSGGAIIGLISLMAEGRIMSDPSFNLDAVIKMSENIIAGISFSAFGALKLARQLKK